MRKLVLLLLYSLLSVTTFGQADSSCDFGSVDVDMGTIAFNYNVGASDFENLQSAFFQRIGEELDLRHQQNPSNHPRQSGYMHVRVIAVASVGFLGAGQAYDICFNYDDDNSYADQLTGTIQGQDDSSDSGGDSSDSGGSSSGGGGGGGDGLPSGGQGIGTTGGTGYGSGGGGGGCASTTVVGSTTEVIVICHTN